MIEFAIVFAGMLVSSSIISLTLVLVGISKELRTARHEFSKLLSSCAGQILRSLEKANETRSKEAEEKRRKDWRTGTSFEVKSDG